MEQPRPDRTRRYTEEEYLRISAASDVKYEFRDGQLIPFGGLERDESGRILGMAGGSAEHADIAVNLTTGLQVRLGKTCKVGNSDLRIRIPRTGLYNYPDVSVTYQPRVFVPPDKTHTLVNPQVVIEVLSPSTADYDRGEKLTDYMGIDSLQEYLLVAHDRPRVDLFGRHRDASWATVRWAVGLDGTIAIPSLGIELPLAEVYAGVALPSRPPIPPE